MDLGGNLGAFFSKNTLAVEALSKSAVTDDYAVFVATMISPHWQFCRFIHDCIRDSDDLIPFFVAEMGDYSDVVMCVLAYYSASEDPRKLLGVRPIFKTSGYSEKHPAHYWEKVGKRMLEEMPAG